MLFIRFWGFYFWSVHPSVPATGRKQRNISSFMEYIARKSFFTNRSVHCCSWPYLKFAYDASDKHKCVILTKLFVPPPPHCTILWACLLDLPFRHLLLLLCSATFPFLLLVSFLCPLLVIGVPKADCPKKAKKRTKYSERRQWGKHFWTLISLVCLLWGPATVSIYSSWEMFLENSRSG